jgi:hypothetical protein
VDSLFAPPQRSAAGIQLFNKLICELGQPPRVGFISYQLAEPSPFFFFFLNCHARSKATTLPNQKGRSPHRTLPPNRSHGKTYAGTLREQECRQYEDIARKHKASES